MNLICTISALTWISDNGENYSWIYIIIGFFLLRYSLRWFLGITRLRREQQNYIDMMENHNSLLERQNKILEQHSALLDKIGKKYL
jgi:hypothetical protein